MFACLYLSCQLIYMNNWIYSCETGLLVLPLKLVHLRHKVPIVITYICQLLCYSPSFIVYVSVGNLVHEWVYEFIQLYYWLSNICNGYEFCNEWRPNISHIKIDVIPPRNGGSPCIDLFYWEYKFLVCLIDEVFNEKLGKRWKMFTSPSFSGFDCLIFGQF